MRTFLRDGARFLQQQGWTLFSLEQKSFPYRNPSLGVFCGIFSIQEWFLGLPKTWRVSYPLKRGHQEIPAWRRQHILMPSPCAPSASGAFSLYAVGFPCTFNSTTPTFRIPLLPSAMMKPRLTAHYIPSLPSYELSLSVKFSLPQGGKSPQFE